GKAVAALVLGLLSFGFLCLTGLPAFILGLLALMDISRSQGRLGGKALAFAGMALSVLSVLCVVPAGGFGLYYGLNYGFGLVRGAADKQHSQNNLKQLGLAMHIYHDSYNSLPPAQGTPGGGPGFPGPGGGAHKVSWRVLILPFIEEQA